jgi:short-subunit dehydrogenase
MHKSSDITILLKIPKDNIPYEMNKLLVVTGGTKGIGRAVLEKFVENGFSAITCARSAEELSKVRQELGAAGNVNTFRADLSEPTQVRAFIDFIASQNRTVDVLVNNAGYFIPGSIATEPEGALEAMMNANLYSAYHLTRGIVPIMQRTGSGHIFNMCSIASMQAYPNGGSYAITKAALLGLSRCLREELKESGIKVTAVMPGATNTASWAGVDLPETRFMKVEDVADMIYASYALSARSVVEEIIIRPQLGDI